MRDRWCPALSCKPGFVAADTNLAPAFGQLDHAVRHPDAALFLQQRQDAPGEGDIPVQVLIDGGYTRLLLLPLAAFVVVQVEKEGCLGEAYLLPPAA